MKIGGFTGPVTGSHYRRTDKYRDNAWYTVDFINGYLCPAEGDVWHADLIYVPIFPDSSVSSQQSATSSQRSKMFTMDKDYSFGQWLYRWFTGETKNYLKLD
ncbi:unnamed protein product [Rotaria socialis]